MVTSSRMWARTKVTSSRRSVRRIRRGMITKKKKSRVPSETHGKGRRDYQGIRPFSTEQVETVEDISWRPTRNDLCFRKVSQRAWCKALRLDKDITIGRVCIVQYRILAYTKTVDSVEGALWLASQTPNILCYLPPTNSGKNGVPVCVRDKRRNHPY